MAGANPALDYPEDPIGLGDKGSPEAMFIYESEGLPDVSQLQFQWNVGVGHGAHTDHTSAALPPDVLRFPEALAYRIYDEFNPETVKREGGALIVTVWMPVDEWLDHCCLQPLKFLIIAPLAAPAGEVHLQPALCTDIKKRRKFIQGIPVLDANCTANGTIQA